MAVKKDVFPANMVGEELKNLLRLIEEEERNANLGETSGPLLDLYETKESVVVEADLPGIDPAGIALCMLPRLPDDRGDEEGEAGRERKDELSLPGALFRAVQEDSKDYSPYKPQKSESGLCQGRFEDNLPEGGREARGADND